MRRRLTPTTDTQLATSQNSITTEIVQLFPLDPSADISTMSCDKDCVVICIVRNGSIKLNIRGVAYKVGNNSMLVIHSGEEVEDVKVSKACSGYVAKVKSKCFATIKVDTASFIVADMVARNIPVFDIDNHHAELIYDIIARMFDINSNELFKLREFIISSFIESLLYLIISVISNSHPTLESLQTNKKNGSLSLLNGFIALLQENYTKERSVDFYATKLGVTAKYLSMVCRKHQGVTASRIIDGIVIRHAKMLLKQHDRSVSDVAKIMNFPSQSFFGKYFKQHVGVSPSRYKGGA